MPRLVIVSNRVPVPKPGAKTQPGGLAVALKDALEGRTAIWFGWSGQTSREPGDEPAIVEANGVSYATIDLSEQELKLYYTGYSNGTLWPLLHYRMGLVEFRREEEEGYRAVNERFARVLAAKLRPEDVIWVHDFHLFPLAGALRRLGLRNRIGFFLHVPFPPAPFFAALPRGEALLADIAEYDLVGMQTEEDAANLAGALAGAGLSTRVEAFPIGMDAEGFAETAARAARSADTKRLAESLNDRALLLGVDRLDYSKGLPNRFLGVDRLLRRFPEQRRHVTFLQVAPVSRGELQQYRALKRELDELAGRINGQHAEVDWAPIRWITRPSARNSLAGYLRLAKVGVVTPLRDGMNLVAKEYVAAQSERDPGVLVLSRFAGAVAELPGAVVVNPHDPDEIAEGLQAALTMPLPERQERWRENMAHLKQNSAARWSKGFLAALGEGARKPETAARPRTEPASRVRDPLA
jgi:trehalose 6-phosphate synthase